MKVLALLGLFSCSGCDVVFGLDRVELPDAASDGRLGDGKRDASAPVIDADPNDILDFAGFAIASVCVTKTVSTNLRLRWDPLGTLTVTATSADPSYVAIDPPQTFLFDSSNWAIPQRVTARGVALTSSPIAITVASPPYTAKTDTLFVRPASLGCP